MSSFAYTKLLALALPQADLSPERIRHYYEKVLPKLALALVPFLLYFAIFALFDPYLLWAAKSTNTSNPSLGCRAF